MKRILALSVTATIVTAVLVTTVIGGTRRARTPGVGYSKDIPQVMPPAPPPAPVALHQFAVERDSTARKLHQDLADVLNAQELPVPPHRTRAFAWINNPQFKFEGWHGFIKTAEKLPDGTHLVTVRLSPLASSSLGNSTTILSHTVEQFQVDLNRKEAKYLRFVDAPYGAEPAFVTD